MYFYAKRALDLLLAIVSISLLWPLLLLVAILIKLDSRGPILYKGIRIGKGGEEFEIFKFRTMVQDAEKLGGFSTSLNDKRLTKIGRYLRRYKVDELPQLFNVLFGTMSIVGPRPQVKYYTDLYNDEERLILTVIPGITDFSSLYFSNMDLTLGNENVDHVYRTKIEPIKNKLRIFYVKNKSVIVDLRIIIETFFHLFGIKNITRLNICELGKLYENEL